MWRRSRSENAWQGLDPDDQEEGHEAAPPFAGAGDRQTAMAALGPAGSGKATAVQAAIEEANDLGARVLSQQRT